jgi:hypothetical protein
MKLQNSSAMRKHTFLAAFLLSVFAASARADLIYSFSFTPTSGSIESFAFSFDVPTYVTTGSGREYNKRQLFRIPNGHGRFI